jgi:hypothetical protein
VTRSSSLDEAVVWATPTRDAMAQGRFLHPLASRLPQLCTSVRRFSLVVRWLDVHCTFSTSALPVTQHPAYSNRGAATSLPGQQ